MRLLLIRNEKRSIMTFLLPQINRGSFRGVCFRGRLEVHQSSFTALFKRPLKEQFVSIFHVWIVGYSLLPNLGTRAHPGRQMILFGPVEVHLYRLFFGRKGQIPLDKPLPQRQWVVAVCFPRMHLYAIEFLVTFFTDCVM